MNKSIDISVSDFSRFSLLYSHLFEEEGDECNTCESETCEGCVYNPN